MSPLERVVVDFITRQLADHPKRPLVLGLQGPQGAGKTTLAGAVLAHLEGRGVRGGAISIDDFYLTRAEQVALAAAHPGNPYLEHRGYPGTHDVALGERTLAQLTTSGDAVVPVYDKSAHGGRGDRAPAEQWRKLEGRQDLVIVEGWMLGFTPVAATSLADARLRAPNEALAAYAAWYRFIDAWIVLRPLAPNYFMEWRIEAEEKMAARGSRALSRAEIEDYVQRFVPAYRTWGGVPTAVSQGRRLELWIDRARALSTPS